MASSIASVVEFLDAVKTVEEVINDGIVNVENRDTEIIPFHCGLAPIFGDLDKDSIKELDEDLKVIISGATNVLAKMVKNARGEDINKVLSWDNVNSKFRRTSLLEPDEDSAVSRRDKLTKDNMNYFRFDGRPDSDVVKEVHSWFEDFIRDRDVLRDTNIDIDVLGAIVAQTGATITDFNSFFSKREYHEQTVLDMGLLRYPDFDRPYFKLYRIKLTAWSESSRFLFAQHDVNGITGEFNLQKYRPRDKVINELPRSIIKKAVQEAEELFDYIS